MNVTKSEFKNRQLHMEDYLQMVSAEQREYAEVFDYCKITEKGGVITDYWTDNGRKETHQETRRTGTLCSVRQRKSLL